MSEHLTMSVIADYQKSEKISLEELARRLGLKSKSRAWELVNGGAPTVENAKKFGELVGRPWHEIMDDVA